MRNRRDFITLLGGAAGDARGASRAGNMVRSTQPPERSSFALTLDGGAPEELLKAGKYDWVSDYARQIVDSKFCTPREAEIEIVLLAPLRRSSDEGGTSRDLMNLADVLTRYDPPEVGDVLRFGAQYPDEQRKTPIIFPHEPWAGPHGPSFVLVLRTDENQTRGLSYAPYSGLLDDWWPIPRIAVRRSGG